MGRKSIVKDRKQITPKAQRWLSLLLVKLQHADLQKITMDDLAELAGVSKSTIYVYFEKKEEILKAVCQTRIDLLTQKVTEIRASEMDIISSYKALIEIFANGLSDISFSFIQSIKEYYPSAWSILESFIDLYIDLLKEQYRKGIDEGIFHPMSIELLGHIDKLFTLQVVTNHVIFTDDKYTLSNLVRDYLRLRLTGLKKIGE